MLVVEVSPHLSSADHPAGFRTSIGATRCGLERRVTNHAAEIAQYLELVPVEHQTDEPYEFAFERYGWISGAY